MPPPTPIIDAAKLLLDDLSACLDANGLHVPAEQGVVLCTPCIKPGCCDFLIAAINAPAIQAKNCVTLEQDIVVWWGTCYEPCATPDPEVPWLIAQEALARLWEQVVYVLTTCNQCDPCPQIISVEKDCQGACAVAKITYRLMIP